MKPEVTNLNHTYCVEHKRITENKNIRFKKNEK